MTLQDIPAVSRIEAAASQHPWKEKHYIDSLESGHICQVAELNGEIVGQGVVMTVADEASLLILTVAKEHHGKGVGYEIVEHLSDLASDSCDTFFLEVRESNNAAFNLYLKTGFSEVGRRANYYPATQHSTSEDAIIMIRDLSFN
ncbi:ribosomal-protein-alanine N-acetyltransferase [Endozoicomonas sp. OPT23]|nr:ribosomal-protein-alanine N-acetyltransferase [Endozoicomonas sp. OPT23]